MQQVYIETSVISYYTGKMSRNIVVAGHQVATKDFWEKITEDELKPIISVLVIREASQGNEEQARKRIDAIQGFTVLDISTEAEDLSELIIEQRGVPNNCPEDALTYCNSIG
ncbi:hypothetical protein QUF74_00860 [Candidatus Halobeggiatoa sp. HSG11]|nr:hypothetical protein [Candidatus Halobeggiatoa sp. HSG11]